MSPVESALIDYNVHVYRYKNLIYVATFKCASSIALFPDDSLNRRLSTSPATLCGIDAFLSALISD